MLERLDLGIHRPRCGEGAVSLCLCLRLWIRLGPSHRPPPFACILSMLCPALPLSLLDETRLMLRVLCQLRHSARHALLVCVSFTIQVAVWYLGGSVARACGLVADEWLKVVAPLLFIAVCIRMLWLVKSLGTTPPSPCRTANMKLTLNDAEDGMVQPSTEKVARGKKRGRKAKDEQWHVIDGYVCTETATVRCNSWWNTKGVMRLAGMTMDQALWTMTGLESVCWVLTLLVTSACSGYQWLTFSICCLCKLPCQRSKSARTSLLVICHHQPGPSLLSFLFFPSLLCVLFFFLKFMRLFTHVETSKNPLTPFSFCFAAQLSCFVPPFPRYNFAYHGFPCFLVECCAPLCVLPCFPPPPLCCAPLALWPG